MPDGNTGPQSKVIAWTSFVVDTRSSKVYSVANGGHNDYAGNEVDVLDLEAVAPAWTQRVAPTPEGELTNCRSYYNDGRPASRHSYYGVTLDASNDRIMLFGGAWWCLNGGFHSAISSYNIGSNQYSPSSTHDHANVGSFGGGVAAYTSDPLTGNVYVSRSSAFGRWNRSSNTFATLSVNGSPPGGDESMSAMDTSRRQLLIVGGLAGDHHVYTISSNAFAAIPLNGAGRDSIVAARGAALIYVDAMDRYLVRLRGAGGTVYQVHPATFEVTMYPTTGGDSVPATQNGPYNKFLYVPRLGGVVYVPSYSANAWFMRLR